MVLCRVCRATLLSLSSIKRQHITPWCGFARSRSGRGRASGLAGMGPATDSYLRKVTAEEESNVNHSHSSSWPTGASWLVTNDLHELTDGATVIPCGTTDKT